MATSVGSIVIFWWPKNLIVQVGRLNRKESWEIEEVKKDIFPVWLFFFLVLLWFPFFVIGAWFRVGPHLWCAPDGSRGETGTQT